MPEWITFDPLSLINKKIVLSKEQKKYSELNLKVVQKDKVKLKTVTVHEIN